MRHIPSSDLLEPNVLEGEPLESQGLLCLCEECVPPWHLLWYNFALQSLPPLLQSLVFPAHSRCLEHFLLAESLICSRNAVFLLDAYAENAREEGGNHEVDSCSVQQAS